MFSEHALRSRGYALNMQINLQQSFNQFKFLAI